MASSETFERYKTFLTGKQVLGDDEWSEINKNYNESDLEKALLVSQEWTISAPGTFRIFGIAKPNRAGQPSSEETTRSNVAVISNVLGANCPVKEVSLADLGDVLKNEALSIAFGNGVKINEFLVTLELSGCALTEMGVTSVASALPHSRTLQRLSMVRCNISPVGAITIGGGLLLNKSLEFLDVRGNAMGDVGVVALCWALTVNTNITSAELGDNQQQTAYAAHLQKRWTDVDTRRRYVPGASAAKSWRAHLRKWLDIGDAARSTMRALLETFLLNPHPAINHTYGAVIAAWLGDTDAALKCLELWPEQAAEVLRECSRGTLTRSGCLLLQAASTDACAAIRIAKEAALVSTSEGELRVVHVHIRGGEGHDNVLLQEALCIGLQSSTRLQLPSRVGPERLQGVLEQVVHTRFFNQTPLTSTPKRTFIHTYGKTLTKEHRARQANNLAAKGSVHVLLLSLRWNGAAVRSEVTPADVTASYSALLTSIQDAAVLSNASGAVAVITVIDRPRGSERCKDWQDLKESISTIQQEWLAKKDCKLTFANTAVEVRLLSVPDVYEKVVPLVRTALREAANPTPVTGALRTVLQQIILPNRLPLELPEGDLQERIATAVCNKYFPLSQQTDLSVRHAVAAFAAATTLRILASRRDIMVFRKPSGQNVCVTDATRVASVLHPPPPPRIRSSRSRASSTKNPMQSEVSTPTNSFRAYAPEPLQALGTLESPRRTSSFSTTSRYGTDTPTEYGYLGAVEEREEEEEFDSYPIQLLDDVLGTGSDGTVVHEGLLNDGSTDGRPVAVRKIPWSLQHRAIRAADAMNACDANYFVLGLICKSEHEDYILQAVERCAMNLGTYAEELGRQKQSNTEALRTSPDLVEILRELVFGTQFLHKKGMVHRNIQPSNVLLAPHITDASTVEVGRPAPRFRAKLGGLGRSKIIGQRGTVDDMERSAKWQAPEVFLQRVCGEAGDVDCDTIAADVFALGCVFYHSLTYGGYPFSAVPSISENLLAGKCDLSALCHDPNAQHLIGWMLQKDPQLRPSLDDVLTHCFFWTPQQKITFFCSLSEQLNAPDLDAAIVNALMANPDICSEGNPWTVKVESDLLMEGKTDRKVPNYKGHLPLELLRCIRNSIRHCQEFSDQLKEAVGATAEGVLAEEVLRYFEEKFPTFLLHCIRVHGAASTMAAADVGAQGGEERTHQNVSAPAAAEATTDQSSAANPRSDKSRSGTADSSDLSGAFRTAQGKWKQGSFSTPLTTPKLSDSRHVGERGAELAASTSDPEHTPRSVGGEGWIDPTSDVSGEEWRGQADIKSPGRVPLARHKIQFDSPRSSSGGSGSAPQASKQPRGPCDLELGEGMYCTRVRCRFVHLKNHGKDLKSPPDVIPAEMLDQRSENYAETSAEGGGSGGKGKADTSGAASTSSSQASPGVKQGGGQPAGATTPPRTPKQSGRGSGRGASPGERRMP